MSEKKYLYCLINCPYEKEFAVDGIGGSGNRVYTVNYRDLAAVVSDMAQAEELKLNRENATAYELVIDTVLKDFTVLPVGFGCIADNTDQIREKVLKPNFDQLEQFLREMDGKIELTLKALWKDNRILHQEVLKVDPGIKSRLDKMMSSSKMDLSQVIISSTSLGKRLVSAMDKIKERYTETILSSFEQVVEDKRLKKIFSPLMIFNAAFLIKRDEEEEFDRAVEELDQKYGKEIKFIYTGPLAPYSFVHFRIALD